LIGRVSVEGSASHQETWRRRIERYERRYFATLRSVVARYASISDVFPEDFHTPAKSVAVYCSDGVLVVRYVAGQDSFEFESALTETIFEASRRLKAGDLSFKAPRGRRWFLEFRNFRVEIRPDGGEEVIVFTADWYSFTAARGFSGPLWSEEQAAFRATWDVLAHVAAPSLGIAAEELSAPGVDAPRRAFSAFETVAKGFQELIESSVLEAPLQEYLTENPALLTLEAARVFPKLKLGDDYITDFVLELGDQQYILVEIEAPTRMLFTKSGYTARELNHAVQQVEDWLQWVDDSAPYIRNKLPGISEPDCWVIIGRRLRDKKLEAKWRRHQRTLARSRIVLLTYDDVLDRAMRQLANLRKLEGIG
jgi:hypothetical protein